MASDIGHYRSTCKRYERRLCHGHNVVIQKNLQFLNAGDIRDV